MTIEYEQRLHLIRLILESFVLTNKPVKLLELTTHVEGIVILNPAVWGAGLPKLTRFELPIDEEDPNGENEEEAFSDEDDEMSLRRRRRLRTCFRS
jgi:hypothetical protein